MMTRYYEKPDIKITVFESENVVTTSALTFGGEKGKAEHESFESLFSK